MYYSYLSLTLMACLIVISQYVPEDSVRHKGRTLLEKIGCKLRVGGLSSIVGRLTVNVTTFTIILFG